MKGYFKGWYFKQQSIESTLAIIPSFHKDRNGRKYAMIQVITDKENHSVVYNYDFRVDEISNSSVRIGKNYFSSNKIELNIEKPELKVQGLLKFDSMKHLCSDIMGPFRFIPFMECRHQVISMLHRVNGKININGKNYVFKNSAGYIEGDRGSSFPSEYIWTQCCWNDGKTNSLMLSVAEIPMYGINFRGIISAIFWHGKEYRLATYNGARVKYIEDGKIEICQGRYTFSAELLQSSPLKLNAPQNGCMGRFIDESPSCIARYEFKCGNNRLFDFISDKAGFEYEYKI